LYAATEENISRQIEHDRWLGARTSASDISSFIYKWFWPLLMAVVLIITGIVILSIKLEK
jgi:hypothetical protein